MNNRNHKHLMAGVILAALVATTMAPAAEAGRRHKERSKPVYAQRTVRHRPQRVVRYVRPNTHRVAHRYYGHHDGHSGLAFLGGLVLGAVISNTAHSDHFFYADPYCDLRFSSLDGYHSHLRRHHHPRVVHVIEIRSGDWVDSYNWRDGDWRRYETDDWQDDWND